MPTNLKKSELVELLDILKIPKRSKYVKSDIEDILSDHLAAVPNDAQLDPRLAAFVTQPADQEDEAVTEEEPEQEEKVEHDLENAEENVQEKIDEVTNKVVSIWTRVRNHGSSLRTRTKSRIQGVHSNISTVASVNWVLILLEYATVVFLVWPRTILGQYVFETDLIQERLRAGLIQYSLFLVLPALLFSFVVNFTKKNAIRRKKHVYAIDPILFGLSRFFTAIVYHLARHDNEYSVLAATSGLTSALVGIYASILQTP